MVRRRLKREPLQYILGSAGFRRLELEVNRNVLIRGRKRSFSWTRFWPGCVNIRAAEM